MLDTGSPGDLSSYISSLNTASVETLQEKLQKLRIELLALWHSHLWRWHWPIVRNWKTLDRQWNIQKATTVLKFLHGLTSKLSERNTSYDLGDPENKLSVQFPHSNYFKNSFSYSGIILWDSLPFKARCAQFLGLFTREISKVLSGTAFMESSNIV